MIIKSGLPNTGSHTIENITGESWFGLSCGTSPIQWVSVTVAVPPPAPSITVFSAAPASIFAGGTSTLSWTVTNAQSCTASGGEPDWSGPKDPASGTQTVAPATPGTHTYTLACENANGTASRDATVTLSTAKPSFAPSLYIQTNAANRTATGLTVERGTTDVTATLTGYVNGAQQCRIEGDWAGNVALQPGVAGYYDHQFSQTVTPVGTGTFSSTAICDNTNGSTTSNAVTLTVVAPPPPGIPSISNARLDGNLFSYSAPIIPVTGDSYRLKFDINQAVVGKKGTCQATIIKPDGGSVTGTTGSGSSATFPAAPSIYVAPFQADQFVAGTWKIQDLVCTNEAGQDSNRISFDVEVVNRPAIASFALAGGAESIHAGGDTGSLEWTSTAAADCELFPRAALPSPCLPAAPRRSARSTAPAPINTH